VEEAVNWSEYFKGISKQCPWSYQAYTQGLIDITEYREILSLDTYEARIYIVDISNAELEQLAEQLDSNDDKNEWLFSYPGYGMFATPVKVLIQQDRKRLQDLRSKLDAYTQSQRWMEVRQQRPLSHQEKS
jgi:hypothetical protein